MGLGVVIRTTVEDRNDFCEMGLSFTIVVLYLWTNNRPCYI